MHGIRPMVNDNSQKFSPPVSILTLRLQRIKGISRGNLMDANMSIEIPNSPPLQEESPTFPPAALPIGSSLKEFVITDVIGDGGFGIVYAAHDTQLQRSVAIKEYMPAAIANRLASTHVSLRSERHKDTFTAGLKSFIDEARLLAQFKHPALVEVLSFWETNGTAYIVMPHYHGTTLRNICRTSAVKTNERWLKSVLGPLLNALELMHTQQIYHRDIAPDNIVIQNNGQPVLLDLGSARRVISGLQTALTVVVKPGYAPIEQYTDDTISEQGPWTDIYALGAVIYFVVTGRAPNASVSRMMKDTLSPLTREQYPDYSDDFLNAVNKALELQPADRYQSIASFRESLNITTAVSEYAIPVNTDNKDTTLSLTGSSSNNNDFDDGKTVILSSVEIEALQNKLLNNNNGPTETATEHIHQKNPLLTIQADNTPQRSSTFDDVKDLTDGANDRGNYRMQISEHPPEQKTKEPAPVNIKHTEPPKQVQSLTLSKKVKIQGAILSTCVLVVIGIFLFITLENSAGSNNTGNTLEQTFPTNAVIIDAPSQVSPTLQIAEPIIDTSFAFSGTAVNRHFDTTPEATAAMPSQQRDNVQPNALNTNRSLETTTAPEESEPAVISQKTQVTAIKLKSETSREQPKQAAHTKKKDVTPAAPTAPETATLKLNIVPWGEIWVGGKKYGVSPPLTSLTLPLGTHDIQIRSPGLTTETRTVKLSHKNNIELKHTFKKNNSTALSSTVPAKTKQSNKKSEAATEKKISTTQSNSPPSVSLAKPVEQWSINITVQPWAEIWVDDKKIGVSPPLHALSLERARHTIRLVHPNYPNKTIQVDAGTDSDTIIKHNFR